MNSVLVECSYDVQGLDQGEHAGMVRASASFRRDDGSRL